jgi:hypothetical protein
MAYTSKFSHFPTKVEISSTLLKQIDTQYLKAFLAQSYGWTEVRAERAIRQYLNFLCLAWLYPERLLIPTREIDCVWHSHILHTCQYRQDCETLFGCYIDHNPESTLTQIADQTVEPAFAQTKVLFERHFGPGSFSSDLQGCEHDDQPAVSAESEWHLIACCTSDPTACGLLLRPAVVVSA